MDPSPAGGCECLVGVIPGNGREMKPATDSGVTESSKAKRGAFRAKETPTGA